MTAGVIDAVHAGSFPGERAEEVLTQTRDGERIDIRVFALDRAAAIAVVDHLRRHHRDVLSPRPIASIVEALDEVGRLWRDSTSTYRREAERLLPTTTGLSPEMVAELLNTMFAGYEAAAFEELLKGELTNPLYLDGFQPAGPTRWCRARGPEVVAHVFGGIDPGLPAIGMTYALLAKSCSMGKVKSAEPFFPALFARSVAEVDPELGAGIVIAWWKGGDAAVEGEVFNRSDAILAFGMDSTVQGIRSKANSRVRVLARGLKMGVALVDREADAACAAGLAYDVVLADQLSCLSPQVVYVEGSHADAAGFGHAIGDGLRELSERLPRGAVEMATRAQLTGYRHTYEFRQMREPDKVELIVPGRTLDWMVIVDHASELRPGPGNRVIRVCPVDSLREATDRLRDERGTVSTVGVGGGVARRADVIEALAAAGVSRVCPIGKMGAPLISWHHDGYSPLRDLVAWTDLETGAAG